MLRMNRNTGLQPKTKLTHMATKSPPQVVRLRGVRLSFPVLWKPRAMEEGKTPTYGANFLLHKVKQKDQIEAVQKAIRTEMAAKGWDKPKALSLCLKQADEKEYDGYTSEFLYISANSQNPFPIVDRNLRPLSEKDGRPYAGCYVNATINIRAYEHKMKKGVAAYVSAIQFHADGEAFGGGHVNVEEEFADVTPEDGDVDDDSDLV